MSRLVGFAWEVLVIACGVLLADWIEHSFHLVR